MPLYVLKPSLIWNSDAPLKVGVRPQEVLVEDFNVFPVQIVKNRDLFFFCFLSPPVLLPSCFLPPIPPPPTAQVPVTVAVAGTHACTAVRYPRYAVLLSDGNIFLKSLASCLTSPLYFSPVISFLYWLLFNFLFLFAPHAPAYFFFSASPSILFPNGWSGHMLALLDIIPLWHHIRKRHKAQPQRWLVCLHTLALKLLRVFAASWSDAGKMTLAGHGLWVTVLRRVCTALGGPSLPFVCYFSSVFPGKTWPSFCCNNCRGHWRLKLSQEREESRTSPVPSSKMVYFRHFICYYCPSSSNLPHWRVLTPLNRSWEMSNCLFSVYYLYRKIQEIVKLWKWKTLVCYSSMSRWGTLKGPTL